MMYRKRSLLGLALLIGSLGALLGCNRLMGRMEINVSQKAEFPAAGITTLDAQTRNGAVTVSGKDDTSHITVNTRIRATGINEKSALACADAVEPILRADDAGTFHVGWRWKLDKRDDWSASVTFKIELPKNIAIVADAHNGAIEVRDTTETCRLNTHNGAITIDATGGPFEAETHNGRIEATVSTERVRFVSHNGRIQVDAKQCASLSGKIESHNGAIRVDLNRNTRADVRCATHNGQLACPEDEAKTSKPTPALDIEAHNGAIRVSRATG